MWTKTATVSAFMNMSLLKVCEHRVIRNPGHLAYGHLANGHLANGFSQYLQGGHLATVWIPVARRPAFEPLVLHLAPA